MAENVIKLFNSHWGIGVTGYASPVPEKNEEELFAFMAIYYKEKCFLCEFLKAEKRSGNSPPILYLSDIIKFLQGC